MKLTIILLTFMGAFFAWFFLLSVMGILFTKLPYKEVVGSSEWFAWYTFIFGWWLAGIPALDMGKRLKLDWFS